MSTFTGVTGIAHNNNKPYQGDALATLGLGLAHITNSVIIRHSCVVLRRQCQINDHALRKHLSPVTLIPVIFKLSAKDGFFSLWKGAVGSGVLWAFSRVSELVIAEVFGLPKSFVPDGSSERFWRHVLLKASNFMFCTPVIVSSFIETVRSGAGLTDDLQILEVIVRGFERLQQDFFGGGGPVADRRRHSIFWLAFPTSFYQTVHFLICRYVYTKAFTWTKTYVSRKMPSERKRYHKIMPELYSTMTAFLVADLACYPLETVLHRLYIQGTRTLVDNLDYGTNAFVPAARYTGLVDCFTSIVRNEGFWALFSGVGAVFLQYALQHCFSALVYWALERGSRGYTSGPLRVKTATSLLPGEQSGSGGGDFTPFKSSSQYPQNPSAQFAKSSSQQTSASIFMADQGPSNGNNNGQYQQQENNPFFAAALRHQRSTGASNNPYAPDWGDDDDSRKQ